MPREIFSPESKEEMFLTASPESQGRPGDATAKGHDGYNEFTIHRDEFTRFSSSRNMRAQGNEMNELHPYVQTLSLSDLEGCVALENVTFPEHERCSKEKVRIENRSNFKWPQVSLIRRKSTKLF